MEKLIRDKILSFSQAKKDGRKIRKASKEEMPHFLQKKLTEECQEVNQEIEQANKAALMEELGDVLEVIEEICQFYQLDYQQVLQIKQNKKDKKGSFSEHYILDLTTNIPKN